MSKIRRVTLTLARGEATQAINRQRRERSPRAQNIGVLFGGFV